MEEGLEHGAPEHGPWRGVEWRGLAQGGRGGGAWRGVVVRGEARRGGVVRVRDIAAIRTENNGCLKIPRCWRYTERDRTNLQGLGQAGPGRAKSPADLYNTSYFCGLAVRVDLYGLA